TREIRLPRQGEVQDLQKEFLRLAGLESRGIDCDRLALMHELTHAAQWDSFDVPGLFSRLDGGNNDLILAVQSVIEGDATLVSWTHQLGNPGDETLGLIVGQYKSGILAGMAGTLPWYLRQSLTFPYGYGTAFIAEFLKAKGGRLEEVNELFRDLPLSTEQIMHPEKFLNPDQRDYPVLITLPNLTHLFGAPWTETFTNVHGEFGIACLLKDAGSGERLSSTRKTVPMGWGGDRYVVLEDGRETTLYVWFSTWDTEVDAERFYGAYRHLLEKKSGKQSLEQGNRVTFDAIKGRIFIEVRGKDVLVLDGASADILVKTEAIWEGVRKTEPMRLVCPRIQISDQK